MGQLFNTPQRAVIPTRNLGGCVPWAPCIFSPFVYNVLTFKTLTQNETRVMAFGFPVRVSWTIKLLTLPLFCPLHSFIPGGGTPSPGGALGYFLGGYVPPGTPKISHPVLEKISRKIDTPF